LLEVLRPQYRVACLSNTNELNVRQFDEELQLQNWFDECFYSNEIGLRKPDPRAYERVSKAPTHLRTKSPFSTTASNA
jgi:FMN phosphatase YigB (HAD superfamily)